MVATSRRLLRGERSRGNRVRDRRELRRSDSPRHPHDRAVALQTESLPPHSGIELFNLEEDPDEWTNGAEEPRYAEIVAEAAQRTRSRDSRSGALRRAALPKTKNAVSPSSQPFPKTSAHAGAMIGTRRIGKPSVEIRFLNRKLLNAIGWLSQSKEVLLLVRPEWISLPGQIERPL